MELLSFHNIAPDEETVIVDFLNLLSIIPLNHDVERTASQRRRAPRRKRPDAIVAASALESQATLITCDHELLATEFPGLRTLNPKASKKGLMP
jgi:predicted nucleic acid-binding protein